MYVPTWARPRCEISSRVKFLVFDRNSTIYKKHWNITLKNLLKHRVRFYIVNCLFTLALVATKVKNPHGVVLSLLLRLRASVFCYVSLGIVISNKLFSHITWYWIAKMVRWYVWCVLLDPRRWRHGTVWHGRRVSLLWFWYNMLIPGETHTHATVTDWHENYLIRIISFIYFASFGPWWQGKRLAERPCISF